MCGHLPFLLSSIETKLSSHPKVDHELHMPKDVLTHKKASLIQKHSYPMTALFDRIFLFFLSYFQSDSHLFSQRRFRKILREQLYLCFVFTKFLKKKKTSNTLFHEILSNCLKNVFTAFLLSKKEVFCGFCLILSSVDVFTKFQ